MVVFWRILELGPASVFGGTVVIRHFEHCQLWSGFSEYFRSLGQFFSVICAQGIDCYMWLWVCSCFHYRLLVFFTSCLWGCKRCRLFCQWVSFEFFLFSPKSPVRGVRNYFRWRVSSKSSKNHSATDQFVSFSLNPYTSIPQIFKDQLIKVFVPWKLISIIFYCI